MPAWPFIAAAYGLTAAGVVAVSLWSWRAVFMAERRAESLRGGRD